MRKIIIRRVIAFSIWCMIISIGINFFNSDAWNTVRHMTPEETFILYPESFFIAIGILCILIGVTVITKNLWMRID